MPKKITFEALQPLIEELTKNKPNQARVKKLMIANGMNYTSDSIHQMGTVLTLMSQISPGTQRIKSKEKEPEL